MTWNGAGDTEGLGWRWGHWGEGHGMELWTLRTWDRDGNSGMTGHGMVLGTLGCGDVGWSWGHWGEGHWGEGHWSEGHWSEGHWGEGHWGEGHWGEGHWGRGLEPGLLGMLGRDAARSCWGWWHTVMRGCGGRRSHRAVPSDEFHRGRLPRRSAALRSRCQ